MLSLRSFYEGGSAGAGGQSCRSLVVAPSGRVARPNPSSSPGQDLALLGSPVGVCQASGAVGTTRTTSPRKEFVSAHGAELEGRKKNQGGEKKVSSYLLLVFLPFTPLPPFGSPAALDRLVVFLPPLPLPLHSSLVCER